MPGKYNLKPNQKGRPHIKLGEGKYPGGPVPLPKSDQFPKVQQASLLLPALDKF